MKNKIFLILLLFLFAVPVYCEEISITASVDRNTVALNENFVYTVTVSGNASNMPKPEAAATPDFNRYGTATSQNITIINGKKNVVLSYNYTLGPKAMGKFTIPPSSVTYKNKTYSTDPIEIEVTAAQTYSQTSVDNASQQQRSNRQREQGKVFVKAGVNKRTVYENEKLVYKFNFYTNVSLVSNPEYFAPDFSGFWNDGSVPKNSAETIDGILYQVGGLETILYPLEAGEKIIPPSKLRIAVMNFSAPDNTDDFFSFFSMGQREFKMLETEAVKIKVLSLPAEGRPTDFSGAVGRFNIKAIADKQSAQTNEPVTVTVQVSGNGNMKSVNKIELDAGEGFKKYDTIVSNSSVDIKEFQIILVPYLPGEKEIPSVKLNFFNPDSKKYETVFTQPIKINITGEPFYEEDLISSVSASSPKKDINYNKEITELKQYSGYFVKNKNFYLLFSPFILILMFALGYRLYKDKFSGNLFSKLKDPYFEKASKYIEKAESEIKKEDFDAFYNSSYKALAEALGGKTGIMPEEIQKNNVLPGLKEKGMNDTLLQKIEKSLDTLEFCRFASLKTDKQSAETLLKDIKEIIAELK